MGHLARRGFALAAFLVASSVGGTAHAAEPEGCDKFAATLSRERGLLQQAGIAGIEAGTAAKATLGTPFNLRLQPFDRASFDRPPERTPKAPNTFGGVVRLDALPGKGAYQVSLSEEAWIDVIQNGAFVKSQGFTGARGCPGIRKSVRFILDAAPVVIQISAAAPEHIIMAVTRGE